MLLPLNGNIAHPPEAHSSRLLLSAPLIEAVAVTKEKYPNFQWDDSRWLLLA
jgi:hypothetical protein